ncbi:TIGR02328 family protein [Metabacillus fastidiosus]|uniref:TIGR02328 family protein n=1 Tax=Metabacillus fastidiosus TaxID=1458 RepID=UPI003D2B5BA9
MRLWHEHLIDRLPRQQLLGQHRECAALRGNGWGKPHATVNYVFEHSYSKLFYYHHLIMQEMKRRGYKVTEEWLDPKYRGKKCTPLKDDLNIDINWLYSKSETIYKEHNECYLKECLDNLKEKGIII